MVYDEILKYCISWLTLQHISDNFHSIISLLLLVKNSGMELCLVWIILKNMFVIKLNKSAWKFHKWKHFDEDEGFIDVSIITWQKRQGLRHRHGPFVRRETFSCFTMLHRRGTHQLKLSWAQLLELSLTPLIFYLQHIVRIWSLQKRAE